MTSWNPYPMLLSTVIFVLLVGAIPSLPFPKAEYLASPIMPEAESVDTSKDAVVADLNSLVASSEASTLEISPALIKEQGDPLIREDLMMPEDPEVVAQLDRISWGGIEIIGDGEEARERVKSYLQALESKGIGIKDTKYIIIKPDCPVLARSVAHTTDQNGIHLMEKFVLDGRKEGVMGVLVHEDAHHRGANEVEARNAEDIALRKLGIENGWCNVGIQKDIYNSVVSIHPEYAEGKVPVDDSWSEKDCLSFLTS